MNFESFFNDNDKQQLKSWWSAISDFDFDIIDSDLQQTTTTDESTSSSSLQHDEHQFLVDPIKPNDYVSMKDIDEQLCLDGFENDEDLLHDTEFQGMLPSFIDCMTEINNNDNVTTFLKVSTSSSSVSITSDIANDDQTVISNNAIDNKSYDIIDSCDNHGEKWNYHFQDLQDFHSEFGHCIVPNSYKQNPTLAKWVKRQRHQYKLKTIGKHSTLTPDREKALAKLDFVWSAQEAMWEERFKELEDFKQVNGHCNVPSTYKENTKLSIWVKSQRRQCKLFQKNQPCFITNDRFLKLKSVGFNWNPRNL